MKKNPVAVLLTALFCSLIFTSIIWADESADTVRPANVTASDIHRLDARGKAERLGKIRALETTLKDDALVAGQTDYNVTYYSVTIDVDVPGQQIFGDVGIHGLATVAELTEIPIDLTSNLIIDSVYITGKTLAYSRSGNVVTITLDESLNRGESFAFNIVYHGQPQGGGLEGFSFDSRLGYPVVTTLSEPYMARSWWPCKDRPDDKCDSLDSYITCDTALFCASNGLLEDTTRHGDGTWTFHYRVRYPITTYLFSLAISKYTIWTNWYHYSAVDSMPIVHHVYPDRYAYSLPRWSVTPYAIGVFAEIFGEYPFLNEKYGHANFEWGGGMEHQTVTSMTSTWFGFDTNTVVHELAHQWWGDMITCNNWHEIWLNEGFASYSEALYYEVANGPAKFHEHMFDMEYHAVGQIYRQDTTDAWGIFDNIVYDKGAWVLHMLRHVVGDENFFDILRAYYNSEYQHADATTEQFKNICESVSGQELDYFFDQWIYGFYRPDYRYSFYSELDPSDNRYFLYLRIRQVQGYTPSVYAMPIDFQINYPSGAPDTVVVFSDARDSVYILKVDAAPSVLNLDPGNWILNGGYADSWVYRLIPFPLTAGIAYESYSDTLITRGGSGFNQFSVLTGNLPLGLTLDEISGVISGMPTTPGQYNFSVYAFDSDDPYFSDTANYILTVLPGLGIPGDATNNGTVDILDIIQLIDFKFKSGPAPVIPQLADVNADCEINVLDIVYLIDNKFKGGPAPLMGCATK